MSKIVLAEDIAEVKEKLSDISYEEYVEPQGNFVYFRFDTDDNDPKEQWTEYCGVQDDLKSCGFILYDPCVEHDCISGDLHYLEPEDE